MLITLHVLVEKCLPLRKPVWSGCIMKGVIFTNLLGRALQIILDLRLVRILGGSWMGV